MSRRKPAVSWRDPEKRMRRAVQLRRDGLSLRQIASTLAVHHRTIERDLARFESRNVDQLLSQLGVAYAPSEGLMRQADATRRDT